MKSNLTPEDRGQVGVYLLQNSETGESYIGSGILDNRKRRHASELKDGKHCNYKLQRAYAHNPNFEFIGVPLEDRETALAVEQALIEEHKDNPLLLNIALDVQAPTTGTQRSEETKEKQRQAAIRRWSDPEERKTQSDKWSALRASGFKRTPESMQGTIEATRKAVIVDGVEYSSQLEAAKAHGISPATVLQRIKSPYFTGWNRANEAPK